MVEPYQNSPLTLASLKWWNTGPSTPPRCIQSKNELPVWVLTPFPVTTNTASITGFRLRQRQRRKSGRFGPTVRRNSFRFASSVIVTKVTQSRLNASYKSLIAASKGDAEFFFYNKNKKCWNRAKLIETSPRVYLKFVAICDIFRWPILARDLEK